MNTSAAFGLAASAGVILRAKQREGAHHDPLGDGRVLVSPHGAHYRCGLACLGCVLHSGLQLLLD